MKELEASEETLPPPTARLALVTPHVYTQLVDLRVALAEVFDLLEGYGPMWYTEDHHNRAFGALIGFDSLLAATASQIHPHQIQGDTQDPC